MKCLGFLFAWLISFAASAVGYQVFEEKGKVGMKDDAGRVVLPAAFEALGWSDGSFSVVGDVTGYRLQGAWGIINLKKEYVTRAEYESLVSCGGDCVVARKKIGTAFTKAGCINLKGEVRIPFVYDGVLVQGLRAIVFNLSGGRYHYGLVDIDNHLLVPLVYKTIRPLGTLRFAVENDDHKIALFADDGRALAGFSIDSISSFYKGFAVIYQDHLQGLIDREGNVRVDPKYNALAISAEGKINGQLPNEWLFISEKNETARNFFAEALTPTEQGTWIIRKGTSYGIVDQELKTLVSLKYGALLGFAGKYIVKRGSQTGIIDDHDKVIVPLQFDSLIGDSKFYRAQSRMGWHLLDADGKELTQKSYDYLLPAGEDGFRCAKKGFAGMINFEGAEFVHCVFDSLASPVDGLIAVKFKGGFGIIDKNEDWLVPPQPFPLRVINRERYLLRQPENNFIKSFHGDILYFTPNPLRFEAESFTEFLPDGATKTISYTGEIIHRTTLPENVIEVYGESEGLRGIKKDDHYGFVDERGRLRIANRYDSIGEFHEGLAAVKLIGKWGFVNTSDQIAINPNYDRCTSFYHGLAVVSRNQKFGLIGPGGTVALPLRYDRVQRLPDGRFQLGIGALNGLADDTGNVLIEPKYASLHEAVPGLLIAGRDGKFGVVTDKGLNVIPMIYDQLTYAAVQRTFLAEKKAEWKSIDLK